MRLALCLHTLRPSSGGVATAVADMATALQAQGHYVSLICFDPPGEPSHSSCSLPVLALGPSLGSYGYLANLSARLQPYAQQFDALILNGLWLHSTAGMAHWARQQKIPYFLFPHGMLDPYFRQRYPLKHLKKLFYWLLVERHTVRHAQAVCYTTSSEQLLAQHTFPFFAPQHQAVTSLPVAPCPFPLPQARQAFFDTFPQFRLQPFLLFMGRIHAKKGLHLLLRAMRQQPSLPLIIAGPIQEAGYHRHLVRLAAQLPGRVHFIGLLTGPAKWGALACAQALVLPSHQENFGMVVAEALSMGTPALVTQPVALSPLVAEHHAGLVAPDTLPGLIHLLWRFSQLSYSGLVSMRQRATHCYLQHLCPSAAGQGLCRLLTSISPT